MSLTATPASLLAAGRPKRRSLGAFECCSRAISHSDGLSLRRPSPQPPSPRALSSLSPARRPAFCVLSSAIPIHHGDALLPRPPSCVLFLDRRRCGDRSVTSSDHVTRRRSAERFTSRQLDSLTLSEAMTAHKRHYTSKLTQAFILSPLTSPDDSGRLYFLG